MITLKKLLFFLFIKLLFLHENWVLSQKNPYFYKGRSVIVHLQEWKYTDIAKECETFLGPHGFGAVQLSPVTENAILKGRPWHERYQPVSYKFITRSGNEIQLRDMIKRCNRVKIRIYVELVLNNMAAGEDIIGTGGSLADGRMLMYPALKFNASDFHKDCNIRDFMNKTQIQECRLHGMPDLNQKQEFVQNAQRDLIDRLIAMGVAGFFISGAELIAPDHLKTLLLKVTDLNTDFEFSPKSRPFIMLDVIDYENGPINK